LSNPEPYIGCSAEGGGGGGGGGEEEEEEEEEEEDEEEEEEEEELPLDTALHPRRLQSSTTTMLQLQKLLQQSFE